MIRLRKLAACAVNTLAVCISTIAMTGILSVAQAEAFRPEIANPLRAAVTLAKSKKFAEAMAKVREADAVSAKTAAESAAIEQMRSYIASSSGDTSAAIKSYERQIESASLSGDAKLRAIQALTALYYQAKDYGKASQWAQRYIKEGGTDPQMRQLPAQLAFLGGDCSSATRQLQADLQAAANAGRAPSEEQLLLLANCASKQKDNGAYGSAMEKLVTWYPKKEYWADLLSKLEWRPNFSSRLQLDVYRLRLATGNLSTADDYMEMAQLALQDGQTAEAKRVVDQGFLVGALGAGSDVERQNRLRNLVDKRIADARAGATQKEPEATADADGTNLLNMGHNYVSAGQSEKGLALMEQAIKKGVKRPDDAKLHLGIAYIQAGQKAKAVQTLKTVSGSEGTADLARLWIAVKPAAARDAAKPRLPGRLPPSK